MLNCFEKLKTKADKTALLLPGLFFFLIVLKKTNQITFLKCLKDMGFKVMQRVTDKEIGGGL